MNTQKLSRLRAQRDALHASLRELSARRRTLLEELHKFDAQAHEFQLRGFDLSAADKQMAADKRAQLEAATRELATLEVHWQSAAALVARCEAYVKSHPKAEVEATDE